MSINIPRIVALLDSSSSMRHEEGPMLRAFELLVAEQQKLSMLCRLSVYQFDYGIQLLYDNMLHRTTPSHTVAGYMACGGTETFTALGDIIDRFSTERNVMVGLFTDGACQCEHTPFSASVVDRVKHRRADGWSFFYGFMHTNGVEGWRRQYPHSVEPQFYGIDPAASITVRLNTEGLQEAMRVFSANITRFRDAAALRA